MTTVAVLHREWVSGGDEVALAALLDLFEEGGDAHARREYERVLRGERRLALEAGQDEA